MVIDDDAMIGELVRQILEPVHLVVALTSAQSALGRIASGERFDLILCDLSMPGMSGSDLHAALQGVAPDQGARMVFVTGGAATAEAQAFLEGIPNRRVQKPFGIHQLQALVESSAR
jgi:CheY-like chemotaxis protein